MCHRLPGKFTVTNSSFVSNSAIHISGSGTGIGGAIFVLTWNGRAVDISNSTFINNRAKFGGTVASRYSSVTLTHVTVLDNSGNDKGLYSIDNGSFNLRNSIIAASAPTSSALCSGQLAQNVGNLIEDGSCFPAFTGDPMLEELTDTSYWSAPQPGSPAIGAGDRRYCLPTDQRGAVRSQVGGCDIGAIEAAPVGGPLTDCRVTTTHVLNFRDGRLGRGLAWWLRTRPCRRRRGRRAGSKSSIAARPVGSARIMW